MTISNQTLAQWREITGLIVAVEGLADGVRHGRSIQEQIRTLKRRIETDIRQAQEAHIAYYFSRDATEGRASTRVYRPIVAGRDAGSTRTSGVAA